MGKLVNLSGQRFGFWIVKNRGINTESGHAQWLCVCECSKEKLVTSNSLRTGNSTSCGCNHTPNLISQKFGKLKVLSLFSSEDKNRRYWSCQCKCGNIIIVSTYKLREKLVKSCGCVANKKLVKHNEELIERGILLLQINEALQKNISNIELSNTKIEFNPINLLPKMV
jgi:hypothetical protein